ncbi:MAG: hypothetical protein JO323_08760 [Acidobacteriia bacterium]|nr:hypothetical protein [Terriglobia bacterium]
MRLFVWAALAGTFAGTLPAQWVHYPTAGVPRTANGTPDLNAPAPRTAGGKPDFSGIWAPEKNRPCPRDGCDDMQIGQEFLNIGWSLREGLPYQPWAAALVKERTATLGRDDPATQCLPGSLIKIHTTPLLRKIVQTPGLMVLLSERNTSFRQIFLDGRSLPEDPQPSWVGYSSGKWDGDTLVVTTNGFRDGLWLDRNGSPLTSAAKMTERFRRVNFGKLEIEITVDDPKAYTRPWTVKLNQFLVVDTELLDYVCLENEKSLTHFVGK